MARVLVGIPTLDRPRYVRAAVLSVLDQTFEDFRIVVSDDGSPLRVQAEIEEFLRGLGRPEIRFHRQRRRGMEYGQGRFLFEQCREDYFVILHDDDLLDPAYLQTAVRCLDSDPSIACFAANPWIIDSRGDRSHEAMLYYDREHGRDRYREGAHEILLPVLEYGLFPVSGTVFRTASLKASGFVDPDLEGNYPFELDLFLNLGARGGRGYLCEERLIGFRYHRDSLRNDLWFNRRILENLIRLLRRHCFAGRAEHVRRKILGVGLRRYAATLLADGQWTGSLRAIAGALRSNPRSWKSWAFAAGASIAPFAVRPFARRIVFSPPEVATLRAVEGSRELESDSDRQIAATRR